MTQEPAAKGPSLEGLVEAGMLRLESLHPGGLELTRELAESCNIRKGVRVLDVAAGTGESACFLAEHFAARVHGIDRSDTMVRRADAKARAKQLGIGFSSADAAKLPFADAAFDVAICECTLCLLDKERVLQEMVRVVRPGGCVGMHDLCWLNHAPDELKRTLAEVEGERPETLEGWRRQFVDAGLIRIRAVDRSELMTRWVQESKRQLGATGQLMLALKVIRRWGLRGARSVLQSSRVFTSDYLGYCMVVGTKA